FCLPRFGGAEHLWMNGLYESLSIIFIFPLVVLMGAGGRLERKRSSAICKLLGDISYPLYITHYPLIYIYTAWVADHKPDFVHAFPVAFGTLVASLLLAYASLKWYDEPLRKWLSRHWQ
ncbi:MAG TPA: acyltransferase family protein, partial [Puia sp.]|nr:acyltransferase family protein [Puia sp.]